MEDPHAKLAADLQAASAQLSSALTRYARSAGSLFIEGVRVEIECQPAFQDNPAYVDASIIADLSIQEGESRS